MPIPENKHELRRFMGMVTYLGKFLPNLSTISTPLRHLLQDDIEWKWTEQCVSALESIKKLITQSPILIDILTQNWTQSYQWMHQSLV